MSDKDNIISSDNPLSEEHRNIVTPLLNTLVPPGEESGLPGAGDLDFPGYLRELGMEMVPLIEQGLQAFVELAQSRNTGDLSELSADDRLALVTEFEKTQPNHFQLLLSQVYSFYYQDDKVKEALGMEPGPPFPKGNTVEPGDLSLLDPVRKRGKIYREL
jgi:hypothetical protein